MSKAFYKEAEGKTFFLPFPSFDLLSRFFLPFLCMRSSEIALKVFFYLIKPENHEISHTHTIRQVDRHIATHVAFWCVFF
jgi:hypothetical protein